MIELLLIPLTILSIIYAIFIFYDLKEKERAITKERSISAHWIKSFNEIQEQWRKGLKQFENDVEKITKEIEIEVEALVEKQDSPILGRISSVIDALIEKFPNIPISKRLEVIRSKAFFRVGDEEEKIRSLQYIGVLGNPQDVSFLNNVINDESRSQNVRDTARKAKKMINPR